MLKALVDYSLLCLGFLFTYLIPGLFIIQNFLPKLPARIKIALCPLLSLLVSTYLVYFISLLIGFSRYSIILCLLAFAPWLVYYFLTKFDFRRLLTLVAKNKAQLLLAFLILVIFFLALYPAIFTFYHGYIVMASVNWQDTAMHTGIIESLAQGNFPPQAPYYAGTPLNYYYFTDFHSAILVRLLGRFFPRVLLYTNPLFAAIFALAVYALAFEVTKNKKTALASGLIASLFGNLMFLRFFQDLLRSQVGLVNLLANRGYSMEYEGLFQLASMADYFLQNRPMMVGLPAVALVLLLLLRGFSKKDWRLILLSGTIVGLVIKFQSFATLIGVISFCLLWLVFFSFRKVKFSLQSGLAFCLPLVLISLPLAGPNLTKLALANFSWGPWERERSLIWQLLFVLANFHLPFILTIVSVVLVRKMNRLRLCLLLLTLALFAIPYSIRFTVYKGDMFKFFYFMIIPLSIVAASLLARRTLLLLALVCLSIFTSLLTLSNSFFNKNRAYTSEEYTAGLWIRQNTPQRSVFVSLPTVHSPITQIGGRLRVLSYINWPYSHGYNSGPDNVFKRLAEVEGFYRDSKAELVKNMVKSYNASYVFYSGEERSQYPATETLLDQSGMLKVVYNSGDIKIYEIEKNF